MSLPTRKIGNTAVTAIGFGAMGLSQGFGDVPPEADRLKFLDEVHARGCTFWDTADQYGDSETLIGKWFARTGKRADIFLATKFGLIDFATTFQPNADPEYVPKAFAASLEKLQTDHVDLYYLHRSSPKVPIEKTVAAMAELVKQGKVKYLGLSDVSAEDLRRAHAVHPIAAVQFEYSVMDLSGEAAGLVQAARELGIAIIPYSPLARGLLTLQYKSMNDIPENDFRRALPRVSEASFPNIVKLAEEVQAIAKRYGATPGQVALAWLHAQADNVIPIPGTKKVKYLDENLGAVNVKLSAEDVAAVRALAEKSSELVPGNRVPDWFDLSYKTTPALQD